MATRLHSQLDRYRLGQTLGDLGVGDVEFFPLKAGETVPQARSRINGLLRVWKASRDSHWRTIARADGVLVKKGKPWKVFIYQPHLTTSSKSDILPFR